MHFNVQSYWQTIIFIVLQPLNAYCASERSINFPFWPNGSAVSLNMDKVWTILFLGKLNLLAVTIQKSCFPYKLITIVNILANTCCCNKTGNLATVIIRNKISQAVNV